MAGNSDEKLQTLTESQRFGLRIAGVVSLLFIAAIALMVIPENGILRDPINHTVMPSPFIKGIVPLIILFSLWFRWLMASLPAQFDVRRIYRI